MRLGLVAGLVLLASLALTPAPLHASAPAPATQALQEIPLKPVATPATSTVNPAFRPSFTMAPRASSPEGSRVADPTGITSPVAAARVPAAAVSSPVVRVGWTGLGASDNGYLASDPAIAPPDVQVAVGPGHVVEMVNLAVSIWTKQGIWLRNSSLMSFFGTPTTEFISDPKIQYDAASGRWFATITDVATGSNVLTGQVILAVSLSSDPTGAWILHKVPSAATGQCLDQPILGVGASTVIVSVNVFSTCLSKKFTYYGARYWVLSKSDLVAGLTSPAVQSFGPYAGTSSFHPAQVLGPSPADYLVSANAYQTSVTTIELFQVTGTPPSATVATSNLTVASITMPPAAAQPGGGSSLPLDTGDFRVLDAMWSGGDLWLTLTDGCTPAGDATIRSCVRLVEISTATGVVAQDFDVSAAGLYYLYPALRADGLGDLLVVFGYSSSTEFPGLMAAGRLFGDIADHIDPPEVVMAGTAPEGLGCTSSAGTCRYGDYFGAALDPSNASLLWAAGEIGTPSGWGTRIFAGSIKALLTFSYGIANGGSGYLPPQVQYTMDGAPRSAALSFAPAEFLADPGTDWSASATLLKPSRQTDEIWLVNATMSPPRGAANRDLVENLTYYHLLRFGFLYVINDHSSATPPVVQARVQDWPASIVAGASAYVDPNSSFAYPSLLNASTGQEQWIAGEPTAGTVAGPGQFTVTYYHQYRVAFDYLLEAASPAPAPLVGYSSRGTNTSVHANATVWADAGGAYAYSDSLAGDSSGVRLGPESGAVGSVTAAGTITVTYRLQYLLNVTVEPGSVEESVVGGGWYDAGRSATLTAAAPGGWTFVGWSGAASGSAPSVTFLMTQPANVTALFYPGLTIMAGAGGSVAYSYGAVSGVVTAGGSLTVYAPIGTRITLAARPSSIADTFGSWGGGATGTSSTTSVALEGPTTVSASFGTNVLVVAGAAGGVVLVILAAVLLLLAARRRRKSPPA